MTAQKRAEALQILADNGGHPIKIQIGQVTVGGGIDNAAICLIDCHAGMIKRLHDSGYSLYLHNGLLTLEHFGS